MKQPEILGYMSSPFLSLKEASRVFDVAYSTLHRLRKAGKLEEVGAFKDPKSGAWRIPAAGLAQLGYRQVTSLGTGDETPSEEHHQTPSGTPSNTPGSSREDELKEALNEAHRRVAIAEAQRDAAEQIARERERTIQVQAQALRMLEGASAARPVEEVAPVPAPEAPSPAPTPPEQQPTPTPEREGLLKRMFRRR